MGTDAAAVGTPPPATARLAWLLAVPLTVASVVLVLGKARGLNWVGFNWDPGYAYLLNGLNILEGAPPAFTGHPGTPVQLVIAGVIWLTHILLGSGGETARSYVLHNPESLLSLFHYALIIGYVLITVVLGRAAYRLSGSVPCAVYAQVVPMLSLATIASAACFTIEAVLLIIGTGLAAVSLAYLRVEQGSVRYPVAIGLLVGLGLATKITFLPAAVFGLLIVRGLRARLVAVSCALAAFLLAVFPALPVARQAFGYFADIALRSGRYGTGEPTVVDVAQYPANVWRLVQAEPLFFALVAASAALLLLLQASMDADARRRRWWSAAVAVVAVQMLQLVLVAKDPQPGYLVPAISLSSLNVCLLFSLCASTWERWRRVLVLVLAGAFISGAGYQARASIQLFRELDDMRARHLSVYSFAQGFREEQLVVFHGSTSPMYALLVGNEWAGRRYSQDLREMFPHAVFYDLGSQRFTVFGGEPVPPEQVAAWLQAGRLLFQGHRALLPRMYHYEVLRDAELEGLFRAHASQP